MPLARPLLRLHFAAALLLLLAACRQEPSFDERYEAAEEKIRTKAAEIDRDLVQANETMNGSDRPQRDTSAKRGDQGQP